MDVNQIMQLINNGWFPIVACGAMAWYIKYNNDKHSKERSMLNDQHKEEMEKVTTAINNNTIALTRLCDKLGADDK